MLEPGTIILDKYCVERVLGKGGMGVVLAVRHQHLGELFALKTMLPAGLENKDAVERFLREARACAKLKSEHVARVHDVGHLRDGTPYMLMEYLEGNDLSVCLERRGPLPLEEVVLYVYQACEAISEAHRNGIVHRDLKPSNLFLTQRSNGTPCVKVLDFGISKQLESPNKAAQKLTKTGEFLGSPMYMSPEQMADIKSADARSDIWSLGNILYELSTGHAPFEADVVTTVVTNVLLSQPAPPSQRQTSLPAAFDAVVMSCLEKRPEARYQSVSELMSALEPFLPAGATWYDRSGSFPRVVMPARIDTVEFGANSVLNSAAALATTLPGNGIVPGVTETVPGGVAVSPLPPYLGIVKPKNEPPYEAASVSRSSPDMATNSKSAVPSRPSWRWIALGTMATLGVAIVVKDNLSSNAIVEEVTESAEEFAESEPAASSSAIVLPQSSALKPSDLPGDIHAVKGTESANVEPLPAPMTTPSKKSTATKTSSTSPTSTSARNQTKKPPVRGYDD